MRLGEVLIARGFCTLDGIEQAVARQREEGGRLGDNLIALGIITGEQLDDLMHETPKSPKTIPGSGVSMSNLLSLMLKFLYLEQRNTPAALGDGLKLPYGIVKQLLDEAVKLKYLEVLGAAESSSTAAAMLESRYALTERGRAQAADALDRNLYVGPAPVSLAAYQEQILKQRITNEQLDAGAIMDCFSDLVIPETFLRKIGPAINSGRTILLYGPPGNGKTSIATRTAKIFQHIIFVPYCLDIDGQIMQVFDSSVHEAAVDAESLAALARQTKGLRKEEFDQRWIPCRRPTVVVGGELSLEMLDLNFSEDAKFYEAPMHVKALNGTFIVDDFGRQLVSPEALLNRWIVPMESRIDFFKLHTGKSFYLPFDELLIFSTNLEPDDLMDPAFLRRIPYKIELFEPTRLDYRRIFEAVSESAGLELTDEIFEAVIRQLQVKNSYSLAYYQPKFVIDQVINACKYEGISPSFNEERVTDALKNLYVKIALEGEADAAREEANAAEEAAAE